MSTKILLLNHLPLARATRPPRILCRYFILQRSVSFTLRSVSLHCKADYLLERVGNMICYRVRALSELVDSCVTLAIEHLFLFQDTKILSLRVFFLFEVYIVLFNEPKKFIFQINVKHKREDIPWIHVCT